MQQSIYSLYIINSSGGLIFDQLFGSAKPTKENAALSLASTWDSMSAIATSLSPVGDCKGISSMEADTFTVEVFQTLTGLKFLLFVAPGTKNAQEILQKVYELYADYVMKDPFYPMDMRIKSEAFKEVLKRTMMIQEGAAGQLRNL